VCVQVCVHVCILARDRPHHWVTPSSGEVDQMGSSRHNFAATPRLPDLSTPLDSLVFLVLMLPLDVELVRRKSWKKQNLRFEQCTHFPNSDLECLHMRKIGPHVMCGFGHGKLCR